MNKCLQCGKDTKNKEFCCAHCRGEFNRGYAENNYNYTRRRSGVGWKEKRG